jgi:hypothetical protein
MSEAIYTGVAIWPPVNATTDQLVVVEYGHDPRLGPTITYEWRGRLTEILLVQNANIALGRKTVRRLNDERTQWILHVTVGVDETANPDDELDDVWSLDWNMIEQDLWLDPRITAIYEALLTPNAATLDQNEGIRQNWARMVRDVDAYIKGEEKTVDSDNEEVDLNAARIKVHTDAMSFTAAMEQELVQFIDAKMRKADAQPTFGWVLKREKLISSNSTIRPNKDNVKRMFSKATLLASEGLTDTEIIGALPEGYWLKLPSRTKRVSFDKWSIEQEYWHAERYAYWLYGAPL